MNATLATSRLYAGITGEAVSLSKRALRTARLIEEDLMASGWPVGKRYGSEQQIAQHFRIGRLVAREAVRILQRRGAARMRRGPGGGMVVAAPAAEEVVRAVCDYFVVAGATIEQLREARSVIDIVTSRFNGLHNAVTALFVRCIEELRARLDRFEAETDDCSGSRPMLATQAARLARELAHEITQSACNQGRRIGSEFDLSERYAVSRSVMRQAIRILEDCGAVEAQRGRGHGLMARAPQPGPTIRLICAYVVGSGTLMQEVWNTCMILHVELARLAAAKVTQEDKQRLDRVILELQRWRGAPDDLPLADAECEVARIARNPILDVLFRAVKAYGSWIGKDGLVVAPGFLVGYPEVATEVLAAVYEGNTRRAAEAQHAKQEFLAGHLSFVRVPHVLTAAALAS
jgi:DNA-binding FadR family transcriptional regulator